MTRGVKYARGNDHGKECWPVEMQAIQQGLREGEFVISKRTGLTRHAKQRLLQPDRFPLTPGELVHAILCPGARIIEGKGTIPAVDVTYTGVPIYQEYKRLIASLTRWDTPVHLWILMGYKRPPRIVTTYDPSLSPWRWNQDYTERV